MTIHLPADLENSIQSAVHSGRFASVDDAMAEAARLLLHTLQQGQPEAGDTASRPLLGSIRDAASPLDRTIVLDALEALKSLPADWSGRGAVPIDRQIIQTAKRFTLSLPSDMVTTPRVMPMMGGRLQLEWHRGSRSLELEFESCDRLHYLKWDSNAGVEDEDVIPVDDTAAVHALLRWFASEPANV